MAQRVERDKNVKHVLDEIKAEPQIKKLLIISKILNVICYILAGGVVIIEILVPLLFGIIGSSNSGSNSNGSFVGLDKLTGFLSSIAVMAVIVVIALILGVVAFFIKLRADNLIDRRLNEAAEACGALNTRPTAKEVKIWKILFMLCDFLYTFLLILMYVLLISGVNYIVLGVFFVLYFVAAFGTRFLKSKKEKTEDMRVSNIIYAQAQMQGKEEAFKEFENAQNQGE